ncbi:MAG: hypothetical protein ABIL18_08420, partial [candidate division WOR-3 bacterium]
YSTAELHRQKNYSIIFIFKQMSSDTSSNQLAKSSFLLFKLFFVLKLPIDYQCRARVYSAFKYLQTKVCHYILTKVLLNLKKAFYKRW